MNKFLRYLGLSGLWIQLALGQIGQFEASLDIGNPKVNGSAEFDETTQAYTLKGGGYNIWFNHDEFQFLYRKIKGDFLLTAHFQLIGNEKGNGHRKTGWMIRENTDHDAVSINSCLHGDGLVVLQWRLMRGAYMRDPEEEIFFPKQYFGENIIQLERIGKTITMRMAHPGEPLEEMGSIGLPGLKDEVLIGPYVLAHDPNGLQTARVWNVRIATPVPPEWHPNRQVKTISHAGVTLGSELELLDVTTGQRRVIYRSDDPLETPQFSSSGGEILFLKAGQAYLLPLAGGQPRLAGPAVSLKPPESDGKFRYDAEAKTGTRQIWRKLLDGSSPQQLTFDLDHAWFPSLSPNQKSLVYLAYPHDSNPQKPGTYQRLSVKLMSLTGGAPKTIAYLLGGDRSLGNNCWSPDGSQLVFVSNSERR